MSHPHIAPNGYTSASLDGGGSVEYQSCVHCGGRIHTINWDAGGAPLSTGEAVGADCPGSRTRPIGAPSMAKRQKTNGAEPPTEPKKRGRPRSVELPGMEDARIKPLEELAAAYADVRDRRIELNREESELKTHAIKLMHKYDKTIYRRDGIEIRLIDGDEDVKVKVKKATEDDSGEVEIGSEQAEA